MTKTRKSDNRMKNNEISNSRTSDGRMIDNRISRNTMTKGRTSGSRKKNNEMSDIGKYSQISDKQNGIQQIVEWQAER